MGVLINSFLLQWKLEKCLKLIDRIDEGLKEVKNGFSEMRREMRDMRDELRKENEETTPVVAMKTPEMKIEGVDVVPNEQEKAENGAELEEKAEDRAEIEEEDEGGAEIEIEITEVNVEVESSEEQKFQSNTIESASVDDDRVVGKVAEEGALVAEYNAVTISRDKPEESMKLTDLYGPSETDQQTSRPLFFMLWTTREVEDSYQGKWRLDRVSKVCWGRSPKFNWRWKSSGPDLSEKMAQIFSLLVQPINQRMGMLPLDETKPFSFNSRLAMTVASIWGLAQIEVAKAEIACLCVNETCGALSLVLGAHVFQFSGIFSTLYGSCKPPLFFYVGKWRRLLAMRELVCLFATNEDKQEEVRVVAGHMKTRLIEHSNFPRAEVANWKGLLVLFDFALLWYFAAQILNFLCLSRYSYVVQNLTVTKAEKEGKLSIAKEVGGMFDLYTDIMGRANKVGIPKVSGLSIDSMMTVHNLISSQEYTEHSQIFGRKPLNFIFLVTLRTRWLFMVGVMMDIRVILICGVQTM